MIDQSVIGNITIVMAFVEGLISFFSPCVIPLLPIYLGYLSGSMEDVKPSRKKSLGFTLVFILGIFVALWLLHVSISWISGFFQDASIWMMRIGGILILFLGLIQLGVLKIPFLERSFHFQLNLYGKKMNLLLAFLMGFTFSFSWTPCIGPALASILILASSSGNLWMSTLLIVAYAIGFSLPFLIISFFAQQATNYLRNHTALLQVIVKVGAILLIVMGVLMFTGKLSIFATTPQETSQEEPQKQEDGSILAPQFSFKDQYGNTVKLSDYKGKIIYLNFWGTWCSACKSELADVQKLYEAYQDSNEVTILTTVFPNIGEEGSEDDIKAFLKEQELSFPVLFDEEGITASTYGIRSFPTMFAINPDQSVLGYLSGAITYDMMEDVLQQVRNHNATK